MGDSAAGHSGARGFATLLVLVVVAMAVRLPGLSKREMWIDEANSVLIALNPVPELIEELRNDGNPPLYYLLLSAWVRVFGFSEIAARGLSLLIGVALVPLVWLVGTRWFGRPAGIAAGLLLAISPMHIYYSRECRMYSLMALLTLAALFWVDRLLERKSRIAFVLTVLFLALCAYTHNYGLFFLPVPIVAALFVPGARWKSLVVAGSAVACASLLLAPWFPVVYRQASTGVGDWIPSLFEGQIEQSYLANLGTPGRFFAALLRSLEVMAPAAPYPFYLRKLPVESVIAPLSLVLVLVGLVAAIACGMIRGSSDRRFFRIALLVFGLIIPMALPIGYSVLIKPVYLVGRYEVLVMPCFVLLVGVGWSAVLGLRRWSSLLGILAACGLSAVTLVPFLSGPSAFAPFARAIAAHLEDKGRQGNIVLFCGVTRATAEYAIRRRGLESRVTFRSFPEDAGKHRGWYDPKVYRAALPEIREEALRLVTELHSELPDEGRLWVLLEGRYPEIHETLLLELNRAFGSFRPRRSLVDVGLFCFLK